MSELNPGFYACQLAALTTQPHVHIVQKLFKFKFKGKYVTLSTLWITPMFTYANMTISLIYISIVAAICVPAIPAPTEL